MQTKGFLGSLGACLLAATAAVGAPGSSVGAVETGWRTVALTGVPDTAVFDSVAVGPAGMAAAGNDFTKDDRGGFVVWRSADGMGWKEVYRDPSGYALGAAIVAVGPGFAAVGTGCRGAEVHATGVDASPDFHCEPMAAASRDGTRWERSTVRPAPPTAPAKAPSTSMQHLAEGPDGGLLAVGWIDHQSGDADPATWRSTDSGRTWVPAGADVPATAGRPDAMKAATWTAQQGWVAIGYEELERSGGSTVYWMRQVPRLWRSDDGVRWHRADPPEHADRLSLLARRGPDVYLTGGSPGGTSIWRSGPNGSWVITDEGFDQAPPSSVFVLATGPEGIVLGGLPNRAEGSDQARIWGSTDGATFRPTFEGPSSTWFVAGARTSDWWFLYATTHAGTNRGMTGWVASPNCATGGRCGGVAALDQVRSSLTEMLSP